MVLVQNMSGRKVGPQKCEDATAVDYRVLFNGLKGTFGIEGNVVAEVVLF